MAIDKDSQWAAVEITETLAGRRAGRSAEEKARDLRRARPISSRIARLMGVHTDERAWRRGAEGERIAGFWLGRLPAGWHVFHDVPVGERGANIDHLVVGPTGVFTINTKNLTGSVWVAERTILHNGRRTSFLPKAVAEARQASELLTRAVGQAVAVRAVLAILADDWTMKAEPPDVIVRGPRSAKNVILRQPVALTTPDVIRIAAAAAKPGTWTAVAAREAPPATSATSSSGACVCGGSWVLRTRKRDRQEFYGCSRFPSCRRTKPITS